jgi:hypothetical protein
VKTVAAVFRRPVDEGRKRHAAGVDAGWLATKPIQEPDPAHRHMLFDFMASIWCGAMVGCIGAMIPPFSESGR